MTQKKQVIQTLLYRRKNGTIAVLETEPVISHARKEDKPMGERKCPFCGAYLDPEERCDCREEEQENGSAASQSNAEPKK